MSHPGGWLILFCERVTHAAIGIHSFCHLILAEKLEFRSGLLKGAETARIHFSGTAAGVGVRALSSRALSQRRDRVGRSRNQLAKAAFSAGSDAAGLGAHRTPERPGANLLPALARANPQTGQGHLNLRFEEPVKALGPEPG